MTSDVKRRVVITGAGTVNPLASDVNSTFSAFREGRCAIGLLDIPDIDRLSVRIGAQVQGFDPTAHFGRAQLPLLDRFAQFALVSARQAVAQAELEFGAPMDPTRCGVVMGTAGGGNMTTDENYRIVYEQGKNRVHPFVVPRLMHNAAASHIAMEFGLLGPGFTVSTACASGNHAIGLALQMIRSGAADVMLAGGSEAMLSFGGIKAWEGLRVMSREGCFPFSAHRSGMVQGEGGAVVVLESLDHARARGARVLAELAGFGMTADASDIVMPTLDGPVRAMRAALSDAGLPADAIGYVNAHGTATSANDRIESAAIAQVMGAHADRVMVSSTKSMHAHLIGGTGAVELLACLMALEDGVIAPTVGYCAPDPDCPLDVVPNTAREARVDAVMSNAFAFGGLNAVLVLRRPE